MLSESAAYNLPSLLQTQTRVKKRYKAPPEVKKDLAVEMRTPLTIMSYRPDRTDNTEGRKPLIKAQTVNKRGSTQKTAASNNHQRYLEDFFRIFMIKLN